MINWLPLSDRKNVPSVKVIIEPETEPRQLYGGYYINNTIVVVQWQFDSDEKELTSTLAHEFRHHIQRYVRNVPVKNIPVNNTGDYEADITNYFRSSISELDALIYQNKTAKSESSDYWLNHLVLPNKRK